MTTIRPKSPGLFLVFCPILIMLQSGWSLLVVLLPRLSVLVPILWGLFEVHKPQLISPSPSCSIVFFSFLSSSKYLFFFRFLLFSLCGLLRRQCPLIDRFSFFVGYHNKFFAQLSVDYFLHQVIFSLILLLC